MDTTRSEIASCLEKAYTSLKTPDALKLLRIKTEAELSEFAKQRKWRVDSAKVHPTFDTRTCLMSNCYRYTLQRRVQLSRPSQRWSSFTKPSLTQRNWRE